MWVKKIDRPEEARIFRYEVNRCGSEMMNDDGSYTTAFCLYKYWCNNDGEFKLCSTNYEVIVSLETLMSKFVIIDSDIDKIITDLRDANHKHMAEKLDNILSPFTTSTVETVSTAENVNVTNLDNITETIPDGSN